MARINEIDHLIDKNMELVTKYTKRSAELIGSIRQLEKERDMITRQKLTLGNNDNHKNIEKLCDKFIEIYNSEKSCDSNRGLLIISSDEDERFNICVGLLKSAKKQGFEYSNISEDHIIVSTIAETSGLACLNLFKENPVKELLIFVTNPLEYLKSVLQKLGNIVSWESLDLEGDDNG